MHKRHLLIRSLPLTLGWSLGLARLNDLAAQPTAPSPRPFILFVHGRGQETRSDSSIMAEWLGAFKVGLKNAGAADLIGPDDVGFAFYQHAFADPPQMDAACVSPGQPTSYEIGTAGRNGIQTVYTSAEAPAYPRHSVEDAILDETRASTNRLPESWIESAALHTGARDTWKYLQLGREYCAVEHVLRNALAQTGRRPLIIVAHSMGTLVTYRYLLRGDTARGGSHGPVIRLITLGSQLGSKSIANRLSGDSAPPYPYPPVQSWVNLHDERDPVAWPLFRFDRSLYAPGGSAGALPVDRRVNVDEAWHQTIGGYLENPLVITAVGESWCAGFGPSTPKACERFRIGVGASDAPIVPTSGIDVSKRTFRYGVPAAIGAAAGSAVLWSRGRVTTLGAAAGGALLGALISAAVDRIRPTQ